MGVAERRERQKKALRQEILAAARELFVKEGYERLSMRKIAEKIEYSPTTIYLYFRDKDELLEQMCEEMFALLLKKISKILAADDDPVELLRAGLKAYVEFGLKHRNHYLATFMIPATKEKPHEFEGSQGAQTFGKLVEAVTKCVAARRFRETDVITISQSLWMVIHGVTSLLISEDSGFPWVDQNLLIDTTIDNALRGWAK
jgi:AcrR family transcriptional regulator